MNCCRSSLSGTMNKKLFKLEPDEACRILYDLPASNKTEEIALEYTMDRVLAKSIYAAFPMPPFNKSPFDGYAFHGEDTPGKLRVVRTIAAGDPAGGPICRGEAVKLFTGSPVPDGADAVVKFEHVEIEDEMLIVKNTLKPDTNVIHAGEDYEKGSLLAAKGEVLTPPLMGLLASQGYGMLPVCQKPTVSLISTGSELKEPGTECFEYGIYNSSKFVLGGYLQKMGLDVGYAGIVADDLDSICAMTLRELERADVVITTGGASVGDYDYAVSSAQSIGAKILFWKVNMKPGGAILAAVKNNKLLLSLSGNPAAAIMGLLLIAQPYLKKLCGYKNAFPEEIEMPLLNMLSKKSHITRLLRGHQEIVDGKVWFVENPGRGNGNIASFENCSHVGIIPPTGEVLPAGTMIRTIFIQ